MPKISKLIRNDEETPKNNFKVPIAPTKKIEKLNKRLEKIEEKSKNSELTDKQSQPPRQRGKKREKDDVFIMKC